MKPLFRLGHSVPRRLLSASAVLLGGGVLLVSGCGEEGDTKADEGTQVAQNDESYGAYGSGGPGGGAPADRMPTGAGGGAAPSGDSGAENGEGGGYQPPEASGTPAGRMPVGVGGSSGGAGSASADEGGGGYRPPEAGSATADGPGTASADGGGYNPYAGGGAPPGVGNGDTGGENGEGGGYAPPEAGGPGGRMPVGSGGGRAAGADGGQGGYAPPEAGGAGQGTASADGGGYNPGAGAPGGNDTASLPDFKEGTIENAVQKIMVAVIRDDYTDVDPYIASNITGDLGDIREGKLSDEKKAELKSKFGALNALKVHRNPRPRGVNDTITLLTGSGKLIRFDARRSSGRKFQVRKMEITDAPAGLRGGGGPAGGGYNPGAGGRNPTAG